MAELTSKNYEKRMKEWEEYGEENVAGRIG